MTNTNMKNTKPATNWVLIEGMYGSIEVLSFQTKQKALQFIKKRGATKGRTAIIDSFNILCVCLRVYGKNPNNYLFA